MSEKLKGPETVALVMDGNRRFAKAQGKSMREGHEAGADVFFSFIDFYTELRKKWGTKNYTFYAFSTENWNRTLEEVAALMGIFEKTFEQLNKLLPKFAKNGIRIRFIGERERLSPSLQKHMQHLEEQTKTHAVGTITLAVSYGGQADILQAVNQLIRKGKEVVTAEDVRSHLWAADIPNPDLIIRTGGEKRLSNFLLWQSAYSELAFTDTLWPDFTQKELEEIFANYAKRERRHGS